MRYLILFLALLWPGNGYACLHDCQLNDNGYILLKHAEGLRLFPYRDVAGHETDGFGHLVLPGEHFPIPLTGPQALAILQADVAERTPTVNKMIAIALPEDSWGSLFDFAYNLGTNTLKKSTLLKRVNQGENELVHDEFMKY